MTRLKFTNPHKEVFWFVALGAPWPHEMDATVFKTEAEALDVLKTAGTPPGWKAVTYPD